MHTKAPISMKAALARAARAGKPAIPLDHRPFTSRESFEDALLEILANHRVEAVILAGFMRVLTPHFLARYPDRVLNIHPSLLPAFPGIDAQGQAFAYGVKVTGCTVHVATAEVDAGPILAQEAVAVLPDDTVDSLHERIKAVERRLYPDTVAAVVAGDLVLPAP